MSPASPAPGARPGRRAALSAAWVDWLVVLAALAAFLLLTTYQLRLPGLYYDEAWDAVSTMQIVHGAPVELERGAHVALFGRDWPLMLDDYQGIVSTYLLVPFFLIGGVSVASIRAFPILSGAVAIVLCYFLARAWFGRPAAWAATWLFAVSPSWVFWSRLGVYVVSEVVPLTLGALLAFTAWWRAPRGRPWLLCLGSFLMGLGLATKLLYLWPIVAVLACYGLLHGRQWWVQRGRGLGALRPAWAAQPGTTAGRVAVLLAGVASFALGAFTFLAYNWQTGGTWLKIQSSFVQTEYGTNNTTVLPNLWEEIDRFRVVLDGGYFWFQTENALPLVDALAAPAFLLAAVGLLIAAIRGLGRGPTAVGPRPSPLVPFGLAGLVVFLLLGAAWWEPNSRDPLLGVPGLLAVLAGGLAGAALVRCALQDPPTWARLAGSVLLILTLAAGATWLAVGAPDGQARGPLDLRLADMGGLLFWIALAELLVLLGWSAPATPWQRPLVATFGFLAAVLAQSFPTLSGLWPTHLVVMLPLPQILVGAGLQIAVTAWRRAGSPAPDPGSGAGEPARLHAVPLLGVAGILALVGSALWTDYRYHDSLSRSGGLFAFSDGIYTLANYLGKAPDQPIVAAEWGIRRPVQILSEGRLTPAEIFQYGPNGDPAILQAFDAALTDTLRDPSTRYVFTADAIGPYNRFAEFSRVLATRGLTPFLEHRSYMADGRPIYEVYTAQPAGR